jgi:hypothetical protein
MQIVKRILFFIRYVIFFNFLFLLFVSCSQNSSNKKGSEQNSIVNAKEELLSLERKWLDAEFALDTAYISTLWIRISLIFQLIIFRINNRH